MQPIPIQQSSNYKLSFLVAGEWVPHSYAPVFTLDSEDGARPSLLAGVPSGDTLAFERLVTSLQPPYFLLYVLHTPRGEGDAGRYQSPPISVEQFRGFINTFGGYLSSDARFDIWAHSATDTATVVWDRHNHLFAYGPVERMAAELRAMGFAEGKVDINFPHQHHYRQECDAQAAALLKAFEWSCSPLREEDAQ